MSRLLGVGAAGCVYAAEWEGQRVAVKLLHPTSADQKSFTRCALACQPSNQYAWLNDRDSTRCMLSRTAVSPR